MIHVLAMLGFACSFCFFLMLGRIGIQSTAEGKSMKVVFREVQAEILPVFCIIVGGMGFVSTLIMIACFFTGRS